MLNKTGLLPESNVWIRSSPGAPFAEIFSFAVLKHLFSVLFPNEKLGGLEASTPESFDTPCLYRAVQDGLDRCHAADIVCVAPPSITHMPRRTASGVVSFDAVGAGSSEA